MIVLAPFKMRSTVLTCYFDNILTLIWVGFLGVRFEVGCVCVGVWGGGRGGGKFPPPPPPPRLKLATIMLKTSNLARKYTST